MDHQDESRPPWSSKIEVLRILRALYPPNLFHIFRNVNTDQLCSERKFLDRYHLDEGEWGVVFPHGMGDIYITCAFAEEVLRQRGGDGFSVFVRPHHAYIPTLFAGINRIVPVSNFNLKRIQQNYHFEPGRLFAAFPMHGSLSIIGHKGVNFVDYCRLFLGLDMNTQPAQPRHQAANELEAGKRILMNSRLRPGKTVVLAPDAYSIQTIPMGFWRDMAGKLLQKGWDVATNCPVESTTPAITGTQALNIPIDKFISVAIAAGWVIALRSGLCELLSHAECKLTVLYPNITDNLQQRLAKGFSLVESGLRLDAQEIWYSAEQAGETIERIVGVA